MMEAIVINPSRNPDGHRIQYDTLEGQYYDASTDLYLTDEQVELYGLGAK